MGNIDIGRAAFDFVDDIERMTDRRLVMDRFSRELSRYGFPAWLITGLPNPGERLEPLIMRNGWPEGWTEIYTQRRYVQRDPVAAHCFRSTVPFEWDEAPYDAATHPAAKKIMERATDFRMNQGYCVPIHSSDDVQAVVTIETASVTPSADPARA